MPYLPINLELHLLWIRFCWRSLTKIGLIWIFEEITEVNSGTGGMEMLGKKEAVEVGK